MPQFASANPIFTISSSRDRGGVSVDGFGHEDRLPSRASPSPRTRPSASSAPPAASSSAFTNWIGGRAHKFCTIYSISSCVSERVRLSAARYVHVRDRDDRLSLLRRGKEGGKEGNVSLGGRNCFTGYWLLDLLRRIRYGFYSACIYLQQSARSDDGALLHSKKLF